MAAISTVLLVICLSNH